MMGDAVGVVGLSFFARVSQGADPSLTSDSKCVHVDGLVPRARGAHVRWLFSG